MLPPWVIATFSGCRSRQVDNAGTDFVVSGPCVHLVAFLGVVTSTECHRMPHETPGNISLITEWLVMVIKMVIKVVIIIEILIEIIMVIKMW